MSYNPTNWVNGETPINATNLNKIETELEKTDTIVGGEAYDDTSTYAVGDFCIYENTLYRCITAVTTAEEFDSTKWSATTVGDELDRLTKSGGIPTDSIIGYDGNAIPAGFEEIQYPEEFYYQSGDKYIISEGAGQVVTKRAIIVGLITNSTANLQFTIPVLKSLANITNITVNTLKMNVRTVNGTYLEANGYTSTGINFNTSPYTVSVGVTTDNLILFNIAKSSAYTNGINNTPCAIEIDELEVTFS